MKKLLFFMPLVIAAVVSVLAGPARPGVWRNIVLADGTAIRAQLMGDEFMHYYATNDGRKFVPSAENPDVFVVADMAKMSGRAAQKRAVRAQRVAKHVQKAVGKAPEMSQIPGYISKYNGVKKGIIILAQFKDKSFLPAHTRQKFDDVANKENYSSADGFVGSVRDYYSAQSGGSFYIDFDVVGPVTLSQKYSYYGKNDPYTDDDMHPGQMVAEACRAVDDEVDFSQYDWDGDGEVDQVYVLYAGYGEASSNDANTVWPHEWALSSSDYGNFLILDGMMIDNYACSNEIGYDSNGKTVSDGIGGICHEFSHCLGLPDYYDTAGNNFGMNTWSVMDAGSYNGDGFCPAGYTAYEKATVGWLDPVELTANAEINTLKPTSQGGEAYMVRNPAASQEFLLLENRQQTGWDSELYGNGLVIMHIDYNERDWWYNTVNTKSARQRCTIFHADNNQYTSISGLAGDPYPYNKNDSLTNLSRPAGVFYNLNTDGTRNINVGIYKIKRNADGTISFLFSASTENPTGIDNNPILPKQTLVQPIYTIDGQYAGTDINILPKGVYISGGRKIIK